ncbi:MAG: hypothetical protein A2103_02020 [Gammaproteobacteria bacterium GWF2_41_13]|nr:MAG: hypothetical protein A2103_02020 [Gammaproteobacteria bacterium GWF2_41_13]
MTPIYVISNGEIFREVLNAIVTIVGTSTFNTALRISVAFSIIGATGHYIFKSSDPGIFLKWFVAYFVVVNILLGPKQSVEIIDTTNPGAVYQVDNVPFGLAIPAGIVTSFMHGLVDEFDTAFQEPDDLSYSKNGFLFGSQLFRLSVGYGIGDPTLRTEFNDYMRNCVIGDILINNKYGFNDLINSTNIWTLISKNPSPIRGLYLNGQFQTCQQATPVLRTALTQDVNNNALTLLGKRLWGDKDPTTQQALLNIYLMSSYQYYAKVSGTAQDIMTQNVMIDAVREGVINYATGLNGSAALLSLSSSRSMEQMRLALGACQRIATYTLPLLQTVIVLIWICLFPIVILLSVQLLLSFTVIKNYFFTLIWVESWPLLYSGFNLLTSFYLQHKTGAIAQGGFTLSNAYPLALEHSDVGTIAGAMMMCIPAISLGLIYGLSSSLNSAMGYITGMMHSSVTGGASEAASGNISLGNISLNNINANKHNFNFAEQRGMASTQLGNGSILTTTADGNTVYDTAGAMSKLPISVNAGTALSESFTHSAEQSQNAALHASQSAQQSLSSAIGKLEQFGHTQGHQVSYGEGSATSEQVSRDQSLSTLYSIAHEVAQRNNISFDTAFSKLSELSGTVGLSGSVNGSVGIENKGNPIAGLKLGADFGAGISGGVSGRGVRDSSVSNSYQNSSSMGITSQEVNQFRDNYSVIDNYNKSHHIDISNTQHASLGDQISADLRTTKTYSDQYSADMSQAERFSNMSNYVQSQSANIQSHFEQGFADYVRKADPMRADAILSNTSSQNIAAIREEYAKSFLNQYAGKIEQSYKDDMSTVNVVDANQYYESAKSNIQTEGNNRADINANYQTNLESIKNTGQKELGHFPIHEMDVISNDINKNQSIYLAEINQDKNNLLKDDRNYNDNIQHSIKTGRHKARLGVIHSMFDGSSAGSKPKQ